MSCYVVEKSTIDRLVTLVLSAAPEIAPTRDPLRLGRLLWTINQEAVNHRYRESGAAPTYARFEFQLDGLPQLVKALDCYLYQADDAPTPHTEFHADLVALAARLSPFVTGLAWTAYQAAEWG